MTSSTFRVPEVPVVADRVLPGLFDDEEDGREEPVLDLLFPIDEGEPDPPTTVLYATPHTSIAQPVTPQAIAIPIVARQRPAPRAWMVFAAYALLGGAIFLFAAALRRTHGEPSAATTSAAPCPSGMTRMPGNDAAGVAPFCVDVTPAPATDCRGRGKRALTGAEREVAARLDPGYAAGPRCATSL